MVLAFIEHMMQSLRPFNDIAYMRLHVFLFKLQGSKCISHYFYRRVKFNRNWLDLDVPLSSIISHNITVTMAQWVVRLTRKVRQSRVQTIPTAPVVSLSMKVHSNCQYSMVPGTDLSVICKSKIDCLIIELRIIILT